MPKPTKNSMLAAKSLSAAGPPTALIVAPRDVHAASPGARRRKPAPKSKGARFGNARSRTSSARKSKPGPPIVRIPSTGPRVPIGDALCQAGFDEHAIAAEWIRIADMLIRECEDGGNQKLLVDVLKECSRQLESAQERHHSGNVIVQLVHTVSRPPRVVAALASANPPVTVEVPAAEPAPPETPAEQESPVTNR